VLRAAVLPLDVAEHQRVRRCELERFYAARSDPHTDHRLGFDQPPAWVAGELEAELPEDLGLIIGVGVDQDPGVVRRLPDDGINLCSVRRGCGSGLLAARVQLAFSASVSATHAATVTAFAPASRAAWYR
jgi:hypothetical protein